MEKRREYFEDNLKKFFYDTGITYSKQLDSKIVNLKKLEHKKIVCLEK